jgi:hypothetical protein
LEPNEGYLIRAKGMLISGELKTDGIKKRLIGPATNDKLVFTSVREAIKARKRLNENEYPWLFEVVKVDIACTAVSDKDLNEALTRKKMWKHGYNVRQGQAEFELRLRDR